MSKISTRTLPFTHTGKQCWPRASLYTGTQCWPCASQARARRRARQCQWCVPSRCSRVWTSEAPPLPPMLHRASRSRPRKFRGGQGQPSQTQGGDLRCGQQDAERKEALSKAGRRYRRRHPAGHVRFGAHGHAVARRTPEHGYPRPQARVAVLAYFMRGAAHVPRRRGGRNRQGCQEARHAESMCFPRCKFSKGLRIQSRGFIL